MALVISAASRPCPGHQDNGDGFRFRERAEDTLLVLVDGVGHGQTAAAITAEALDEVDRYEAPELPPLLARLDRRLDRSRGAAVSLIRMAHRTASIEYIGVGNVAGYLWTPEGMRTLVNQNGTVGRLRHVPEASRYETLDQQLLLLHSDGISSRVVRGLMKEWDGRLERMADLALDRANPYDDATFVVARIVHPKGSTSHTSGAGRSGE